MGTLEPVDPSLWADCEERKPTKGKFQTLPAPSFQWDGKVATATIYTSHYHRLKTVADAARSGNETLLKYALAELDKWGSSDGPKDAKLPEKGEGRMKRDMDTVRAIFIAIQAKTDQQPAQIEIPGREQHIVDQHVRLLIDANYINGVNRPGFEPMVKDLTWQGHDFAGVVLADKTTWERVQEAIGAEGLSQMPLRMIYTVAEKAVTAWALQKLGL